MRALVLALAILAPQAAMTESITYHLVGTVETVDNGSANTIDLRGTFTPGTSFVLDLPVERSTVPNHPDEFTSIYSNMGTNAHFTIGPYACTGSASSAVAIENDFYGVDEFDFTMYTPTAPPAGTATPGFLQLALSDASGTALASNLLPRPMPDISAWSTRKWSLTFSGGGKYGTVAGQFGSLTTPAATTSWGRIRSFFRR